jgi:hypothetical protein
MGRYICLRTINEPERFSWTAIKTRTQVFLRGT